MGQPPLGGNPSFEAICLNTYRSAIGYWTGLPVREVSIGIEARWRMIEVRACPLCASPERSLRFWGYDREYGIPGRFPLYVCKSCSLGYLGLVPVPEELGRYYPADYTAYHQAFGLSARVLSRMEGLRSFQGKSTYFGVPLVPPPCPGARALDIGAGAGVLSRLYAARGWKVVGADSSRSASQAAHGRGSEVLLADAVRLPFRPGSFDAILANQVLEHLYRPGHALASWFDLLRPGGTLLLGVPNLAYPPVRWFGKHTFATLSIPRHLIHFTPSSLRWALQAVGFEEIRVNSSLFPIFGGSLLLKMGAGAQVVKSSLLAQLVIVTFGPLDALLHGRLRGAVLVAQATRPLDGSDGVCAQVPTGTISRPRK